MILFFENGRLGNQLFQYSGIRAFFPDHRLVLCGFADLRSVSVGLKARFLSKKRFLSVNLNGLLQRLLRLLVSLRLVGLVTEGHSGHQYRLSVRRGLLPNLFVTENLFFQHQDAVSKFAEPITLKSELVEQAKAWLMNKGLDFIKNELIFVHVRRGDYIAWPSKQFPAVLDWIWYEGAIEAIRKKKPNAKFILMSDDQFYLRDIVEESESLIVSENPHYIDLAIMSLCKHGILSASSFAWWGANLSRQHFHSKAKERQVFLAPKYWIGHRANEWYPASFISDWLIYVDDPLDLL